MHTPRTQTMRAISSEAEFAIYMVAAGTCVLAVAVHCAYVVYTKSK